MQTIINLGTGGADLNGQNGSTTSADSNDALFLDWPGDNAGNYVYLPGVGGNYLSVPDEAALDITGDLDVRLFLSADDWSPSSVQMFMDKGSVAGNFSWQVRLLTSGAPALRWSSNGSTITLQTCTSPIPTSDGDPVWLRITREASTGDTAFYTSSDASSWTQLGTTVAGATGNLFAGTSPVNIGFGSAVYLAGKFYRAEVWDGIEGSGGTKVLDVDCSQIASGADTSFTALTGQTVTINRSTSGRKSVAVTSPAWLLGTDDLLQVAHDDRLVFDSSTSGTVLAVIRQWATPVTAGRIIAKGLAAGARYYLYSSSTVAGANASDGTVADAETFTVTDDGSIRVLVLVIDRDAGLQSLYVDGAVRGTDNISASVATYGASTGPLVIGATSGFGTFQDFELVAAGVYRRALTSNEIAALTTYYQNKVA